MSEGKQRNAGSAGVRTKDMLCCGIYVPVQLEVERLHFRHWYISECGVYELPSQPFCEANRKEMNIVIHS